jgi:hypothetical protein
LKNRGVTDVFLHAAGPRLAATMGQARADAFVDLILAHACVSTVVDLALPAGFATAGAARPGWVVERAGTLTSAGIEAILADPDTVFRRLVIDPDTGWLVDAGASTYHPGRHLARMVRKRDLHCRFPGCATPARFCDLDHVIPFPLGRTVLANLACLCRRHHRLKTHGHWSLTISPLGVCTWVDRRTGVVHTTEPADYRELAV